MQLARWRKNLQVINVRFHQYWASLFLPAQFPKVSFLSAPLGTRLFCWVGLWRLLCCRGTGTGMRGGYRVCPCQGLQWKEINKLGGFHRGETCSRGIYINQSLQRGFGVLLIRIWLSHRKNTVPKGRHSWEGKPAPCHREEPHLRTCLHPQSRCGLMLKPVSGTTKSQGGNNGAWVCAGCKIWIPRHPKLTAVLWLLDFSPVSSLCQGQTHPISPPSTERQRMDEGCGKFTRCQPVETQPLWA